MNTYPPPQQAYQAQPVVAQPVGNAGMNTPLMQQQYQQQQQFAAPVAAPVAAYVGGSKNGGGASYSGGGTVATAMPSAPPMESIQTPMIPDASRIENHPPPKADGGHHGSADAGSAPGAVFFTAEEIRTLKGQPTPQDAPKPVGDVNQSYAAPVPVAVAQPATVMTTAAGMPVMVGAVSPARTERDGWHGIKSSDPVLNNTDSVLQFLNYHNNRPRVACRVHGYHYETRHRSVRRTDSDGNERWETETYEEQVTDFDYRIDLSRFVFPYGYIQSASAEGLSVPAIINKFLADSNSLKSLEMKKEIGFDFHSLRSYVHNHIRALGWWRGLSITFPKSNYTVRVWQKNCLSSMWENPCCFCLCHVTIVPCILMRCYRDCGGHHSTAIRSYFQIQYHPLQIFEMIRPLLWCTGYTPFDMASEMYRDMFW